jgi:putative ABC transport system substrate-binding protein
VPERDDQGPSHWPKPHPFRSGRNARIDTRWATTNADDIRRHAAELAALAPDVILAATGTTTVVPLLQATRTVPIVFVIVIDPVGAGFVASLARPGGNATGFLMFEYGLSAKWLELGPGGVSFWGHQ